MKCNIRSRVESPVNISSLNTAAAVKAAAVAAAAIQPNPNESGSPRFVHPGWRVMTALLCRGAYLLPVVGGCTGLVLSGLSLLQGLEGPWKVNMEPVLCLSIPGGGVCACVSVWGRTRSLFPWQPPLLTPTVHPSPPEKNPGGLCVMRFH